MPAWPVGPVDPCVPVDPVDPCAPVGPVDPCAPVGPVDPCAPVGPRILNAKGHASGGVGKGESVLYVVPPFVALSEDSLESSKKVLGDPVKSNKTVPGIFVNSVVGGVKLLVYTAEVTTRKLVIYPGKETPSREE